MFSLLKKVRLLNLTWHWCPWDLITDSQCKDKICTGKTKEPLSSHTGVCDWNTANHVYPCPLLKWDMTEVETHAAHHGSKSLGCVRMAALVKFLRMSGSSGGMLICWEQYNVSGRGMAVIYKKNQYSPISRWNRAESRSETKYDCYQHPETTHVVLWKSESNMEATLCLKSSNSCG